MNPSWDRLTGVTVAGKYVLEKPLGGGDADAFFLTQGAPGGGRAVLKLVREEPETSAAQLARWRGTACVSHPNLLALYDCGRAGLISKSADASYLFAVFEYPDDNLALALERGPLSEAETIEVLRAALDGLEYIHSQGLVHGSVDPAHIVAVGERIKLASDTLREPGTGFSPAEDVRALGTMLQVLMGMPELTAIADPLRSIIRHATEPNAGRRWTLREIARFLDPPGGVLAEEEKPARPKISLPRWAYALIAVPVAALLLIAVGHRSGPSRPAPVPPPAPVRQSAAQAVRPAPSNAAERMHAEPGRVWRVIAYTYSGFREADKKARHINAKFPSFHAEVFTPRGHGRPPYLISLGGRMTRAEAARLQHAARSRGLPRDTFIRNYSD